MKICIVSGVFAPESGGPATYAPTLASKLASAGHEVTVVTFSQKESFPADKSYPFRLIRVVRGNKLLNRFRFFAAVWTHVRKTDSLYLLDWFAAGVPTAIAARLARKPYIVRVGGDYLWEQRYLENDKTPIALGEFYYSGFYRHYPVLFRTIRWVLAGAAHVVFNTDIQRQLFETHYGLTRTSTIYNPVPTTETAGIERGVPEKEFVFWGRLIVMKNVSALIRAFAQADIAGYTLAIIGDGPRKRELQALVNELGIESRARFEVARPLHEVLQRVKNCRAFVLPSWTDISPNQVYESMAIGLPALVTKENYLSIRDQLPETIDPGSIPDIAAKLRLLADDDSYQQFAHDFRSIVFHWTWNDVLSAHQALFNEVAGV